MSGGLRIANGRDNRRKSQRGGGRKSVILSLLLLLLPLLLRRFRLWCWPCCCWLSVLSVKGSKCQTHWAKRKGTRKGKRRQDLQRSQKEEGGDAEEGGDGGMLLGVEGWRGGRGSAVGLRFRAGLGWELCGFGLGLGRGDMAETRERGQKTRPRRGCLVHCGVRVEC